MTAKKIATLVNRMSSLGLETAPGTPYLTDSNETLALILNDLRNEAKVETYSDADLTKAHHAFALLFARYIGNDPEERWVVLCHDIRAGLQSYSHSLAILAKVKGRYPNGYQGSIRHQGVRRLGTHRIEPGDLKEARARVARQIAAMTVEETKVDAVAAQIFATCRDYASHTMMDVPVDMDETQMGDYRTISIHDNDLVNRPFEVLLDQKSTSGDGNLLKRLVAARDRMNRPQSPDLRGCRIVTIHDRFNKKPATYLVPPAVLPGGWGLGSDADTRVLKDRFVSLQADYQDVADLHGNGAPLRVTMFGNLNPLFFLEPHEIPDGMEIRCDNQGHAVFHRGRTHQIRGAGREAIRISILNAIADIDERAALKAATPITMKTLHMNVVEAMDQDTRTRLYTFLGDLQDAKSTGVRVPTLRASVDGVEIIVRPSKTFEPVFTVALGKHISLAGTVLTFKSDLNIPDTMRQALQQKPIENLAGHPLLIGATIRRIRDVPNSNRQTYVAVDLDMGQDIVWTQDLPMAA